MTALACPACKRELAPEAFLDALSSWSRDIDVAILRCPSCRKTSEVQLGDGTVSFGYVYFGGSAHFAGMEDVALDGLSVTKDDALAVTYGGRSWRVSSS